MGQAQQQSVHSVEVAEQISVFMDGELGEHEIGRVLDVAKGPTGIETWSAYHLIGDTLRSVDLAGAGSTASFVSRFSASLEQEPHLLAPAPVAAHRSRFFMRPSWVRRAVPGTAIAAAVAAVSWVVVPQMRGPGGGAPDAIVAQAEQPAGRSGALVTVSADNAQMIRDPRLDEYLRAHRVSVATDGIVPAMRNVANSATFSQDNTQE